MLDALATAIPWLVTGAIGALVGLAELINRYRDDPWAAAKTAPGLIYLAINSGAGLLALVFLRGAEADFGMQAGSALEWTRVLVAGLGAMAIFRSSVFNASLGDREVAIGPAGLLQVLVEAVDRSVDRARARFRARQVPKIMEGVSFPRAQEALPAYCLALLQNLPPEDQKVLGNDLKGLIEADMDEEVKTLTLGLVLMNATGPEVLRSAIDSLGERIREEM